MTDTMIVTDQEIRLRCLEGAVTMAASVVGQQQVTARQIIGMAQDFEAYVKTGYPSE